MIRKFLYSVVMQGFARSKKMGAGVEVQAMAPQSMEPQAKAQISPGKLKGSDRFYELLAELRRQEELFYGRAKPLSVIDEN